MELSAIQDKIRRYLDSDAASPIIVDVDGAEDVATIEMEFGAGSVSIVDASAYCQDDELPQMDALLHDMATRNGNTFLTGLSTFLALQGIMVMKRTLRSLLDLHIKGKVVVLTCGLACHLDFEDPRIESAGKVLKQNGRTTVWPTLYFVSPDLKEHVGAACTGISKMPLAVEQDLREEIYVITTKHRTDFANCLLPIKEYSYAYDIIKEKYPCLSPLPMEIGTKENLAYLLSQIDEYGEWEEYVNKTLGGRDQLLGHLPILTSTNTDKAWAFFAALKLHGVSDNEYLSKAIALSNSRTELLEAICNLIIDTRIASKHFPSQYNERREVLSNLQVPSAIIVDFCKLCEGKGAEGIHYLTDLTIQEKETVLKLVDQYRNEYGEKELEKILMRVFPDLNVYLSDFNYGSDLLNRYFHTYKYNKVVNCITPELRQMMEEQAEQRDFNTLLQPRSQVLERKDLRKSRLYFVDALGAEFLSYIQDRCFAHGLICDIDIARCELPSITSENKEFINTFDEAGAQCISVKKLDDVKHAGTDTYNYQNTKLPLHLIEELRIIDEIVGNIETELYKHEVDKIFIVSDHGASRLAVINKKENKWELSEKGQHSGRCCPTSDVDEQPSFAIEDNGFWCLANYDRFKGGRKANVEVHGGASLEEVTIPIIELQLAGNTVKCEIIESSRIITVSFKKKARIQLFVAKIADDIQVCLEGRYYPAVPSEQRYVYDVEMPDVKRGAYSIDVYCGKNRIAQGLTFEAKGAGASENKYF